ncbi:hypothetical protein [Algoriphagus sp. A40]|uniref:hypothetical protein n=1 Tax=Algoriphagus sp. A40 TaxID=1945863 RepID=UPI00098767B2|nr:hypothetical protein [Algoriphagus sp. A40]OOG75310.1 hypothetical protein B0E43_10025 [Algoriphagus sp. A40]
MEKIVNLLEFRGEGSTLFTGRPQGVSAREKLNLKDLDESQYNVKVIIPKGTTSFNPSFFLGLFFDSIKKMGLNRFKSKYKFVYEDEDDRVGNVLKGHVNEAFMHAENSLKNRTSLKKLFS